MQDDDQEATQEARQRLEAVHRLVSIPKKFSLSIYQRWIFKGEKGQDLPFPILLHLY
jgi:hypothetical protein